MVFAKLFCVQKPYFYKNTMFAAAAAACLCSSHSFCSSVRVFFCRQQSNQLNSTTFHVIVDSNVALRS
jgi:hypothetical protein